ncbi:unnamed protein product [Paramecium pentaurelia]|uniref:Uncharacterized protein n=1 Tax=Paramecium pentaurelia TaxID=43138 RepID=A0A8S1UYN7_9CILI|nr:unnamed protein product [Paramecium pentaurelia]
MEKSYFKIQTIILIIGLFSYVKGSQLVTFEDMCTCEQLVYENECLANKICNFSNQECKTIPCDQLSAGNCHNNHKCALVNNQCVVFKSCSSHNAKTEEACDNLNHSCYFDDNDQTCREIQNINLGSCSEDLFSLCLIANEGLCIRKGGVCQEMKICEDSKSDDFQCFLAFPACEPKIDKCQSHLKCSESEWLDCRIAKEKINGDKYQLCMKGSNGCVDFDPSVQTKDTCWNSSSLFYHWDGKECSRCSWDSIIISVLSIALLILSI